MFIEILFKMLLFKGGVLIYAEHCIFDPALKFDKQINSVVKPAFFQLRMIAKIKYFISFKDLETVIHAFISSRLDYCNSLYLEVA